MSWSRQARGQDLPSARPVPARAPGGQPLTALQHGMLLHTLSAPEDGVYVQQKIVTLRHELDPARLDRAIAALVARHPVLRTTFHVADARTPTQVVRERVRIHLDVRDYRHADAATGADADARVAAFLAEDATRPFDVAVAPPMRFTLLRLADARWEFVWTSHHALMDGRSYALLLVELFDIYAGTDPATLPKRMPFTWYTDWLAGRDTDAEDAFWRTALAGFTTPTRLGVDGEHTVPAGLPTFGEVTGELDPTATAAAKEVAGRHDATVNNVVQAAWALLLHAYSGERDVVFGTTRSCRSFDPEASDAVGLLINTLPFRVAVTPERTVGELVRALRVRHRELRGAEHTPLPRIHDLSAVPRGRSLFDSVLMFENHTVRTVLRQRGGAWADRDFRLAERTNYPLTLSAYLDGGLVLKLGHDRRRVTDAAARTLLGDFVALLTAAVAAPDTAIGDLPVPPGAAARRPVLAGADRRRVLVEWNDTATDYPAGERVPDLFAAQARRTPDATALVAGDEELSYRELDARSDRLAAELVARGAGPGERVGVYLDRTARLPVALLAVQKSGAAYVPLDPIYPPDRLRQMISDSGLRLVVTESTLAAALPQTGAGTLLLDTEADRIDRHPVGQRFARGDLAYVIYTSGSTGRPKGVQIGHRALTNFLCAMARRPGCGPADSLLAVTTVCFDIAGLELYLPLITGARVELVPAEVAADGFALAAVLAQRRPTIMQATPATWRMLIGAGWRGDDRLRVLCGGEALPPSLARDLLDRAGRVWNLYGPTETTIWSTVAEVLRDRPVTIGRPIANTRCYVLDRWGQPVPVGGTGELYIGGDGVAEGYRNRPELTAERFVPDRFTGTGRLYRTGDLVRLDEHGDLVYLDRADTQVKLHGFRIELGEVEETLRRDPQVREAVAVVREDTPGDRRLVAYVVPAGAEPDVGRVRERLRAALPAYMVPSAMVALPRLPLTPNGKVDRSALPAATATGPVRAVPVTPLQRRVAEIWRRALRIDQIGVDDNFFDLGGNSLLLMHVVKELRESVSVELTRVDVFRYPTVRAMAEHLSARGGPPAPAPAAAPRRRTDSLGALRRARSRREGPAAR